MLSSQNDQSDSGSSKTRLPVSEIPAPFRETRLLNPLERILEIMFGLIMVLSFTCVISVTQTGRPELREMLIAAIGCNLAWGIIDAIFFILTSLVEQGRNVSIIRFVRNTSDTEKAKDHIAESLPPLFSEMVQPEQLENIRKELHKLNPTAIRVRITGRDLRMALSIFLLVFISTFPVAIPFVVIQNVQMALRISNLVAITLLFVGGWILGRYGGFNKILSGLAIAMIGIILVFITIQLGG